MSYSIFKKFLFHQYMIAAYLGDELAHELSLDFSDGFFYHNKDMRNGDSFHIDMKRG